MACLVFHRAQNKFPPTLLVYIAQQRINPLTFTRIWHSCYYSQLPRHNLKTRKQIGQCDTLLVMTDEL